MAYIPPNPDGIALPAASSPVVMPALSIIGTTQATPALNYEFLTNSTSGWFDALGYNWMSLSMTLTGITAGIIHFQGSNDPSSLLTSSYIYFQDSTFSYPSAVSNVSSTSVRHFEYPISMRYIRVIVGTAFPTGSVAISATLRASGPSPGSQSLGFVSALPAGTNNFGNVGLSAGSNTIGAINNIMHASFIQSSGSSITTTTTSAVDPLTSLPCAATIGVDAYAISGTGVTLDVVIQESMDGVNFTDLYHFERITTGGALGQRISPVLRIHGNYLRNVRIVSGTSPDIACYVERQSKATNGVNMRTYYDRTLNSGTPLNGVTGSYYAQGSNRVHMSVSSLSASTPCSMYLQGSMDRLNWFNITTPLATATTGLVGITANAAVKWIRGSVAVGGTSQVLEYVNFSAVGQ